MVIVDHQKLGFTLRHAFFPDQRDLESLVGAMTPRTVLRARQTSVIVGDHSWLVQRSPCSTGILDLTRGPDKLFADMLRTTRQALHRADDMKARIRVTRNDPASVHDFHRMHNDLVRRTGYTTPIGMHELREWLRVGDLFVLYLDDRAAIGHIAIPDRQARRVVVQLAGSRPHSGDETGVIDARCNRYLHWLELQHYAAEGFEIFDLGGLLAPDHPITRFKMSFGATRVEEHFYVFARPALGFALRLHRTPAVQALHRLAGA